VAKGSKAVEGEEAKPKSSSGGTKSSKSTAKTKSKTAPSSKDSKEEPKEETRAVAAPAEDKAPTEGRGNAPAGAVVEAKTKGEVKKEAKQEVELEARFVNLAAGVATPADLKGASARGGSVILSAEKVAALFQQISAEAAVEVLQVPRVTTLGLKRAEVEVSRPFRYATDWEGGPKKIRWYPTEFETRKLGVSLAVQPKVNADGSIRLDVAPELVELVKITDTDARGEAVAIGGDMNRPLSKHILADPEFKVPVGHRAKPQFQIRRAKATVTVPEGQTVALALDLATTRSSKSVSDKSRGPERRVWVLVTPRLVSGDDASSAVATGPKAEARAAVAATPPAATTSAASPTAPVAPVPQPAAAPASPEKGTVRETGTMAANATTTVPPAAPAAVQPAATGPAKDEPKLDPLFLALADKKPSETRAPAVVPGPSAPLPIAPAVTPEPAPVSPPAPMAASAPAPVRVPAPVPTPVAPVPQPVTASGVKPAAPVAPVAPVTAAPRAPEPAVPMTIAPVADAGRTPPPLTGVASAAGQSVNPAMNRLGGGMVPIVELRDASLGDAVDFLRQTARDLDPAHEGLNFVITPAASAAMKTEKISLSLRQVTFGDLLKYLTVASNLRYTVDRGAVALHLENDPYRQSR